MLKRCCECFKYIDKFVHIDEKNYDDWWVKMHAILDFQEVDEVVKKSFQQTSIFVQCNVGVWQEYRWLQGFEKDTFWKRYFEL